MKQNKTAQIIISITSLIVIVVFISFAIKSFNPSSGSSQGGQSDEVEKPFNADIENNETISKIKEMEDFGVPEPNNLGKTNLFKQE